MVPGTQGFKYPLTAIDFYSHYIALPGEQVPPKAPRGGMTGVGVNALLATARKYDLLCAGAGNNYLFPIMGIYAEHCSSVASQAWGEIIGGKSNGKNCNENLISVLQKSFLLPSLSALQK